MKHEMSKIEEYKVKKKTAKDAKMFHRAFTVSTCDKLGATVRVSDTYMGFYGKSWPDSVIKGVESIFRSNIMWAVRKYVERAEKEAEDARKEAKNEAIEALRITSLEEEKEYEA